VTFVFSNNFSPEMTWLKQNIHLSITDAFIILASTVLLNDTITVCV